MPTRIETSNKHPKFINFVTKMSRCLALLETKANSHRKWMDSYNLKIRAYERSGANFADGAIDLGLSTFNSSDTWLSSVLIHETVHFWQFGAGHYKAGKTAELEANKHQMTVLKKIGAPENEIAHLQSQNGEHGDINGDGVYDWKDYRKRDW